MRRLVRNLALLAGAFATALLPCLPTLALETPCTMSGCVDSSVGLVTSATCCCAASNAPAQTSDAQGLSMSGLRGLVPAPPGIPGQGAAPLTAPVEAASAPPDPVPLYLRNATFLS